MPTDDGAFEQNLLKHYGDPTATYDGQGVLKLKDGQELKCRFEAGQLRRGDVLLLCDFLPPLPYDENISAFRFEGTTSKGYRISCDKRITEINYLPDLSEEVRTAVFAAYLLEEMSVQMNNTPVQAKTARFGVQNFLFTGTNGQKSGNFYHRILPLSLKDASGETVLSIIPVKQYSSIALRVQTLKTIDVTCDAVGDISEEGSIARLKEVIGDLCCIMSVARGTKIQWIYCDRYSESGELIMRTHSSRVTKPYCPLPIIDHRAEGRHETRIFLEQAYSAYVSKRDSYRLDKGTIDAYLDAKAEQDFLEMRAAKLAVAMEMLKMVFLELPDSPAKEYVLKEEQFNKLLGPLGSAIDQALKDEGIDEKSRTALCSHGKIKSLNRRSFRYVMDSLCKNIGLEVEQNDLALFVECRNKLVHSGQFYCAAATKEEREKCPPLPSKTHEYFFLVNFLDRIFLKLLGYNGVYIDWHVPGEPTRKEQV